MRERSNDEREALRRSRCNCGRRHHARVRPRWSVRGPERPGAQVSERNDLWAVVNSDGTLARQTKDITDEVHIAMGQYRVFAKGGVRNCAYVATAGDAGLGVPPRTDADVAQGFFDTRSAFVETYDSTGARVDSDFYLPILC